MFFGVKFLFTFKIMVGVHFWRRDGFYPITFFNFFLKFKNNNSIIIWIEEFHVKSLLMSTNQWNLHVNKIIQRFDLFFLKVSHVTLENEFYRKKTRHSVNKCFTCGKTCCRHILSFFSGSIMKIVIFILYNFLCRVNNVVIENNWKKPLKK